MFLGVPRQLAGRAFHFNLFFGEKPQKRIFTAITNANKITIYEFGFTILIRHKTLINKNIVKFCQPNSDSNKPNKI